MVEGTCHHQRRVMALGTVGSQMARARGDFAAAASSREHADIRCINFNAAYHMHATSF